MTHLQHHIDLLIWPISKKTPRRETVTSVEVTRKYNTSQVRSGALYSYRGTFVIGRVAAHVTS